MSDEFHVVPFRPSANVNVAASEWLANLDRGDLSAEEREAFREWISEDPRHQDALKEVAALWYGLNMPLSKLGYIPSSPIARAPVFRFKNMAAAAGILALATWAATFLLPVEAPEARGYYETNVGETRVITLQDGSKISLNTNSIVEQDYSRTLRVIRLIAGEAIFDVAHNKDRPFLVYAMNSMVRAVGTKFDVRVESDKVSIQVLEGRIALEPRLDTVSSVNVALPQALEAPPSFMVGKGEVAQLDHKANATKETISDRELSDHLSWAQGQLVFHDKKLQSVVDEVARYTTVNIEIDDAALRDRKITGILPLGDVNRMLEGMKGALGVNVHWISSNVVQLTAG